MRLPREDITTIMLSSYCKFYRDGDNHIVPGVTAAPRHYFGFGPEDVAEIHTHKQGTGEGVWFRLRDGRVFDEFGLPASSERGLYDSKPVPSQARR